MILKRTCLLLIAAALLAWSAASPADEPYGTAPPAPPGDRYDDIGGDDIEVAFDPYLSRPAMDIAGNGDIYAAFEFGDVAADDLRIMVVRSQDGGDTWSLFGHFTYPAPAYAATPSVHIAEGVEDRCFVAYILDSGTGSWSVVLASSPLYGDVGSWDFTSIAGSSSYKYKRPRVISDAATYSQYYVYLVCQGSDGGTASIWFTRSTDQGTSFEPIYAIGGTPHSSGVYHSPRISYGLGGYLHVVWYYRSIDDSFDGGIRYRRASSFAGGGISSWGSMMHLTDIHDGVYDMLPRVSGSLTSNDVVVTYTRLEDVEGEWEYADPGIQVSTDAGVNFTTATIPGGMHNVCTIVQQPQTQDWIFGGWSGYGGGACLQRASAADPTSWSAPEIFADTYYARHLNIDMPIALDPTRGYRAASLWTAATNDDDKLYFDAEWRRDPGYPNYAPGSPVTLDHQPGSPPALADLDHDGDLEIIYGDTTDGLHAYHHDGTFVQGWPVSVGRVLSDGPAAVGALEWNDDLYVAAGTADGWVYLYDASGDPVPGWPQDTETGASAYVSIGSLGDPGGRTVVIASDGYLTFRNLAGELPGGAYEHWSGRVYHAPCAIGDVDGDEVSEVVCGLSDQVVAWKMQSVGAIFSRILPSNLSDAVTLGDLDLDGDVEVIVPTADGTLYALNEDGSDVPGEWPYLSPAGSALTSGAVAQCLGTANPDVAVAAQAGDVYLLWDDGDPQEAGFPAETGGLITGAPVIGSVIGSPDLIVGATDERIWSWDNFGGRNPGWPKDLDDDIELSPAYGDLDQDGYTEVVVLGTSMLAVLDVLETPSGPSRTWPMYAYDARRTGCANCEENLPSSDTDDETAVAVTRLDFRVATLQAGTEPVRFSFDLPHYAAVALEVFDVQGRRVDTVLKAEYEAGRYGADWNGHNRHGTKLAPGQYYARLNVRGGGRSQTLLRKVLVMP
ncbi:MAG: hypothetical protein GF355_14295 [Candidatus Eisenbacteria bacterium]|nr:hypothetical protein [Candidatus Eisenbacteria bacterium]